MIATEPERNAPAGPRAAKYLPFAAAILGVAAAAVGAATAPGQSEAGRAIASLTAAGQQEILDNAERFSRLDRGTQDRLRRLAASVAADQRLAADLESYRAFLDGLPLYRREELRREKNTERKIGLVREIASASSVTPTPRDDVFSQWEAYIGDEQNYGRVTDAFVDTLPFDEAERDAMAGLDPRERAAWVVGRLGNLTDPRRGRGVGGMLPEMLRVLDERGDTLLRRLPADRPETPSTVRSSRGEIALPLTSFLGETAKRWDAWKLTTTDDAALRSQFAGLPAAEVADAIALPPAELRVRLARETAAAQVGDLPIPEADRAKAEAILKSATAFGGFISALRRRGRSPGGNGDRGLRTPFEFLRGLGPPPGEDEPGRGRPGAPRGDEDRRGGFGNRRPGEDRERRFEPGDQRPGQKPGRGGERP
ncbi:MAG: hypothetical protein AAF532_05085 [Planctomycetota bacterium]